MSVDESYQSVLPDEADSSLLSIEENSILENCQTVDLGDPFEEYDGVSSKFDYGDNNIHSECVKRKQL